MIITDMKMKKIQGLPNELPQLLRARFKGCDVYDSSSSPEARVYYVDTEGGYFVKHGAAGTLRPETLLTRYFHRLGLGAEVVLALSDRNDVLVTRKIKGQDLTSPEYIKEPKKLALSMGKALRALHEMKVLDSPEPHRTEKYLANFEQGYAIRRFDPSYIDGRLGLTDMEAAFEFADRNKGTLLQDTLIHGDFCLPNIIFHGDRLSGYIDLGGAGIGDRHIDLFWGAWTLNFNLGTDEYRGTFFDAYGRELIDEEKLLLISVIEAFG